MSIVRALVRMALPFRVFRCQPQYLDATVMARLQEYNVSFADMPERRAHPTDLFFPRGLCTVLPRLTLLSPRSFQAVNVWQEGVQFVTSPLGVGGRTLNAGKTVVACDTKNEGNGMEGIAADQLVLLGENGLDWFTLPPLACQWVCGKRGAPYLFAGDDHIDKTASLLRTKDGAVTLVLSPKCTFCIDNRLVNFDAVKRLLDSGERLGLSLRCLESMRVPFLLNLVQFPDGRVLMTGGDDEAASEIEEIVGSGMVHTTDLPIRYYPAWAEAGIRSLLGELDWLYSEALRRVQ